MSTHREGAHIVSACVFKIPLMHRSSHGPLGASVSTSRASTLGTSGAKNDRSHTCLLFICSLSGRVCCGRFLAFLRSAPPRLCINSVTGHVIGGGQSVWKHWAPSRRLTVCLHLPLNISQRVDGKAKRADHQPGIFIKSRCWTLRRTQKPNRRSWISPRAGCEALRHYRCTESADGMENK